MKNLSKILLLVATIATNSQILAQRACNARDNNCSANPWRYNGTRDHSRDGLASAAVRPVDLVLGNSEVAYTLTTPARVPADAVLPPWPYIDRD